MIGESGLTVRPRPRFWTRRFGWSFTPAAGVALAGALTLLASGNALLPFQPTVTYEGKMASKADFFEDPQVQRLLLKHHMRVHVTSTGSRELATHDLSPYDFVFPSGKPQADLIIADRTRRGLKATPRGVFTTPVVLATYREYAETLVRAGAAKRADPKQPQPLYYALDMARFVKLMQQDVTWDDLGLGRQPTADGEPISNGNQVAASGPSVCDSNSAGTYLSLVAFVANGMRPPSAAQAPRIAAEIKPLLTKQGMPEADIFPSYATPEGKGIGPVVVVYEHEYLAYQLAFRARTGRPDPERVLLYPSPQAQTNPSFISLDPDAERLGDLLATDPALRRRATELGFQVLGADPAGSNELDRYLTDQQLPPPRFTDRTQLRVAELGALEKMIVAVGDCPT